MAIDVLPAVSVVQNREQSAGASKSFGLTKAALPIISVAAALVESWATAVLVVEVPAEFAVDLLIRRTSL